MYNVHQILILLFSFFFFFCFGMKRGGNLWGSCLILTLACSALPPLLSPEKFHKMLNSSSDNEDI